MTRGGTVYFTAKAVLNTGEESALSPAYSWVVPVVTPPVVTLTSIAVSGPSSVNEGGTGTYTATATWSDGTTTSVTPTWSENSSYATISTGGVLTASAVTANQTVTVTASYTSGGVTRTASQSVTIVNVAATLTSIAVSGPSSVNEGAHRHVHGDGDLERQLDHVGHPDLEREPWDDQRRGAVHRAVGDGEPDGDASGRATPAAA